MCGSRHRRKRKCTLDELGGYSRPCQGLKGGPAAGGHHATKVKEEGYGLIQSARDPCVHSNVRERMWTMRHIDDYVIVVLLPRCAKLTEDMGHTMLLRDVQFLEPRQATGEISGLDAGTDNQWIQVDDQSTVDRRHCARLWGWQTRQGSVPRLV